MADTLELAPINGGFHTCRFTPVAVLGTNLDLAIVRMKSPGTLLVTGIVSQGGGQGGTGLTGLTITRATDYGGTHVTVASGTNIATGGTSALLPTILQSTASPHITGTNGTFQFLLDATAGREFKVQGVANTNGCTVEIDVSAADRSFIDRPGV